MKRRLVVMCVAVFGIVLSSFFGTGAGGASATGSQGLPVDVTASPRDSWACVVVEHVNLGVCQGNPLPPTLPVDVPDAPV